MNLEENRLQVVDALRGFAIVSIMLLHNIEHFDFIYSPAGLPEWMVKGPLETIWHNATWAGYNIK